MKTKRRSFIPQSLRGKILLSVLVLFGFTFWLVSWQTIENIEAEFANYHHERLERKAKTVLAFIQLEMGMGGRDESLSSIVKKAALINSLDINLIDSSGRTLVYYKEHEGVYKGGNIERLYESSPKFLEELKVGESIYLSAYYLLEETKEKAYIHIPYLVDDEQLDEEIYSLLYRLIPIYLLIFLVVAAFAYFFAVRFTKSLSLVSDHLQSLKLGSEYEEIPYAGEDEIGQLVHQYNLTLKELEKNVNLLAKSEREMAWRDMAKQVAHEIKNPLTPMKLSVQHLQRVMSDDPEKGAKIVEKVSKSLIEQIDHLSRIASEFSSFAQLPMDQMEELSLNQIIENVVDVFSSEDDVSIEFNAPLNVEVFGDKSQLIRVFTNLLKNAIQAKKQEENLAIQIHLKADDCNVTVEVKDNGSGIPEEARDRIFSPNFTTKNSGMGIGLAMCKRSIEIMKGTIDFESVEGQGTSFFIKLPLIRK